MSIPETPKAPKPDDITQKLKLELKEWEKCFAAAHGGRKAGREDIKQNPDIGTIMNPMRYENALMDNSKQIQAIQQASSRHQ